MRQAIQNQGRLGSLGSYEKAGNTISIPMQDKEYRPDAQFNSPSIHQIPLLFQTFKMLLYEVKKFF